MLAYVSTLILFRYLHRPRGRSVSTIEDPSRPYEWREQEPSVKDSIQNIVFNLLPLYLVLVRRQKGSLSRRFKSTNLIDRSKVYLIGYRVLLIIPIVDDNGFQKAIVKRAGSCLWVNTNIAVAKLL